MRDPLGRLTFREKLLNFALWLAILFVIFCTWAVVVLISYAIFLLWKEVL